MGAVGPRHRRALVAGVGLGFALDSGGSSSADTTAPVSVTITRPGTTLDDGSETVTLPATTVRQHIGLDRDDNDDDDA